MTTVILVRHADIDLPPLSDDPPLNSAGRERAETLAHVAGGAGVTTIFTSVFTRTKQTVGPLATRLGLGPSEAPPPPVLASQVLSGSLGQVVVVAGHSNTVPQIIDAFGGPASVPVIGEREFDNLYVVTTGVPGEAILVRLKYGDRSV